MLSWTDIELLWTRWSLAARKKERTFHQSLAIDQRLNPRQSSHRWSLKCRQRIGNLKRMNMKEQFIFASNSLVFMQSRVNPNNSRLSVFSHWTVHEKRYAVNKLRFGNLSISDWYRNQLREIRSITTGERRINEMFQLLMFAGHEHRSLLFLAPLWRAGLCLFSLSLIAWFPRSSSSSSLSLSHSPSAAAAAASLSFFLLSLFVFLVSRSSLIRNEEMIWLSVCVVAATTFPLPARLYFFSYTI